MLKAPHYKKLLAALNNPKAAADAPLLKNAITAYQHWTRQQLALTTSGAVRLNEMVRLLNEYKDYIEVDLIATRGSDFLKQQKGQLELDNSILEEFLTHLIDPKLLNHLPTFELETVSPTAFMPLAFRPKQILSLNEKPEVVLKVKDQDFTIGKPVFYKFSSDSGFAPAQTTEGKFFLAVLAAECKVNYDKTMFQECAGTASRLKQGCPVSKYYALVEYLDMQPEDVRLTDIDNVFLLRKAKRLPFEKRSILAEVKAQHKNYPIALDVIQRFVQEIQFFIDATWYDPDEALKRGSFI